MMEVYRAGDAAEAGYLCDLLAQHGIQARDEAGSRIVVSAKDEGRARAIVLESMAGVEDEDRVGTLRRILRSGNRLVTLLILVLLVFAFATFATGRADPLTLAVLTALVMLLLWVAWRSR